MEPYAPTLAALKVNALSLLRQAAAFESPSRWATSIILHAQRLVDAIDFVERDEKKIAEDERLKAEGK